VLRQEERLCSAIERKGIFPATSPRKSICLIKQALCGVGGRGWLVRGDGVVVRAGEHDNRDAGGNGNLFDYPGESEGHSSYSLPSLGKQWEPIQEIQQIESRMRMMALSARIRAFRLGDNGSNRGRKQAGNAVRARCRSWF